MSVSIVCQSCQAKINAPDKVAGKRVKCPKCGEPLLVPSATNPILDVPLKPTSAEILRLPETKKCPFCGGKVMAIAGKCRHCDETIDVTLRAAEEAKREAKKDRRRSKAEADPITSPMERDSRPSPPPRGEMIFCYACRKRIADNALTCPKCGAVQTPESREKGRRIKKQINIISKVVGGVIVLALLSCCLAGIFSGKSASPPENLIHYEVLKEKRRGDGKVFLDVLVNEKASKVDVMKLAEWLWQKGDNVQMNVYDSPAVYEASEWEAREGRANPTIPQQDMSRHWLVQADIDVGEGVRWVAEGRDH